MSERFNPDGVASFHDCISGFDIPLIRGLIATLCGFAMRRTRDGEPNRNVVEPSIRFERMSAYEALAVCAVLH